MPSAQALQGGLRLVQLQIATDLGDVGEAQRGEVIVRDLALAGDLEVDQIGVVVLGLQEAGDGLQRADPAGLGVRHGKGIGREVEGSPEVGIEGEVELVIDGAQEFLRLPEMGLDRLQTLHDHGELHRGQRQVQRVGVGGHRRKRQQLGDDRLAEPVSLAHERDDLSGVNLADRATEPFISAGFQPVRDLPRQFGRNLG